MRLAKYLKREGLTLAAFADLVGCSIGTASKINRGLNKPDWATMEKIWMATKGAVLPNDFMPIVDR